MTNEPGTRRWRDVAGAWMGIGTAPGALLVGAGLAVRHGGTLPVASLALGIALLAAIVWLQGSMGLRSPLGESADLTEISRRYFSPVMRRITGVLIGIGMTGWFGVNVGMGASSLAALTGLPQWLGASLIGLPVLWLALRGMRLWNRLAAVTTVCVLGLVGWILMGSARSGLPLTASFPSVSDLAADIAVIIGYVGVFSIRAPDFTAGLASRRDLGVVVVLLVAPMIVVVIAGAVLVRLTGLANLGQAGTALTSLALGNLLISAAVIAPTFTTIYSGAPALRAGFNLGERSSVLFVALVGLALAIAHFDQWLIPWLSVLGAMLPPIVVPLLAEFFSRRAGHLPRAVPLWPWLSGAAIACTLALFRHPLAMVIGFLTTGVATVAWQMRGGPPFVPLTHREETKT